MFFLFPFFSVKEYPNKGCKPLQRVVSIGVSFHGTGPRDTNVIARSVERKARWKKNGSASSTTCPGAGLGTCFGSDNTESIEKRVPYKDMGRWQQVSAHTPVAMLHMLCLFSHVFASLQVSSGWRNALSSVRRRSLLLHILSFSANAKQICSPACSLRMHVGW